MPLRPRLDAAITARRLAARLWAGAWTDVGTPERLAALNTP
jgi:MurNAc alpha-1-phosphate uridylyltransferase